MRSVDVERDAVEGVKGYLVLECCAKETLADVLATQSLSPQRRKQLCRQVTLGLACVHSIGVAHRDLKPANVLVAQRENTRQLPAAPQDR